VQNNATVKNNRFIYSIFLVVRTGIENGELIDLVYKKVE